MFAEDLKRLIDGTYAGNKKIIARCHLLAHRGYLSKKLIESHDCIAKKCTFFEKLKPEYWQAIEAQGQKKKNNRLKRKQKLAVENDRDVFIHETLEDGGHIHITSICAEKRNFLVISYIYDIKMDLSSEIQFLRKTLKSTIKLQARKGSDAAIETLIRKPRRDRGNTTDLQKAPGVGKAAKKRLVALGIYCLEDLFGRNGDTLGSVPIMRFVI